VGEWNPLKCIIRIIRVKPLLSSRIIRNLYNVKCYIYLTCTSTKLHSDSVSHSESIPKLTFSEWMHNAVFLTPMRRSISGILIKIFGAQRHVLGSSSSLHSYTYL
jgi:hypothetical protein